MAILSIALYEEGIETCLHDLGRHEDQATLLLTPEEEGIETGPTVVYRPSA